MDQNKNVREMISCKQDYMGFVEEPCTDHIIEYREILTV